MNVELIEVDDAEHESVLDAAETVLRELGERLDRPVPNGHLQRGLLALGLKARSLFLGFGHLIRSDAPTAAFVLLRPAVEVNLVARFLADGGELHLDLWEAEAELERLKWIRQPARDAELAALVGWPGLASDWDKLTNQIEAEVEASRARGLAAGVQGISRKPNHNVLPNMRNIAELHGDLSTRHAYWAAFGPLSVHTHASARGFLDGGWTELDGGERITFTELRDPAQQIRPYRSLATTIYASTLTVVSEPLGLDALEPAARTRDFLVRLSPRIADSAS